MFEIPVSMKRNRTIKAYLYILLAGILYAFGQQAFLQVAKILSVGLSSIAGVFTFIFPVLLAYISLIYFVLNVPLLAFFWNKNAKRFTYRTLFFLLTQAIIGSIFIAPGIHDWLFKITNNSKEISEGELWKLPILSIIGAIIMGVGIAISWKYGGSTGGTDIITYYYSTVYKKSISSIMYVMAMLMIVISFSFTIAFNSEIRSKWLYTLFSTIIYAFISTAIVDVVYPKYKKVEMVVSSTKINLISKKLKESGYWHAWSINNITSGYTSEKKKQLTTTMYMLEQKEVTAFIANIDPDVFISVRPVYKVKGSLSSTWVEER